MVHASPDGGEEYFGWNDRRGKKDFEWRGGKDGKGGFAEGYSTKVSAGAGGIKNNISDLFLQIS